MPVYKYRSFDEAETALWTPDPGPDYYRNAAELWELANRLSPISFPKGVFKYRSIEAADEQRDEWERAHALKLRAERRAGVSFDLPFRPGSSRPKRHNTDDT